MFGGGPTNELHPFTKSSEACLFESADSTALLSGILKGLDDEIGYGSRYKFVLVRLDFELWKPLWSQQVPVAIFSV